MTKPIVVAMEASASSIEALEEALPIARRRGAEIVMVHATPLPGDENGEYDMISPGVLAGYHSLLKSKLAKTRTEIAEIRQRYLGRGVEISLSLLADVAEKAVATVAEEVDAAFIVVGSKRERGVSRFLLGSVAERVSRFTDRDVLVARGTVENGVYNNVLVAVDFSATSDKAFQRALELTAEGGKITLFHCVQLPPAVAGFVSTDVIAAMQGPVAERLKETAAAGRQRNLDVSVVIEGGYPPEKLREQAQSADLVVMGSHGRRGFRRFLLGSVAEKTIRHAPCSVYIARADPN